MSQGDDHRVSRLPDRLPGLDHVPSHHAALHPKKTAVKQPTASRQGESPDAIRKRWPRGRGVRPTGRLQEFILNTSREEHTDGSTATTPQDRDQKRETHLSSPWQSFERVFDFTLGRGSDVAIALRKGSPRDMVIVSKVTIAQRIDNDRAQELLNLICTFRHQNVVHFVEPYSFSVSANSFFAIMEFCEGSIADFVNCVAWPWECHIATIMKQINDGIEFLARHMLHVPPQNLENTWVTLAGDVKIAGHVDWVHTPVFNDEHRSQYLEALSSVAIELMSKIKVNGSEEMKKALENCEHVYPDGVSLVRRMMEKPFLKVEGMDQVYQYPHTQKIELALDQGILRNQAFFRQADKGREELRWLVLFSNMAAWKPWAYGRKEDS